MTIQEIREKVEAELLTMRENEGPRDTSLAPYRACPSCDGVLREEEDAYLRCWTCGAVLGLPQRRRK